MDGMGITGIEGVFRREVMQGKVGQLIFDDTIFLIIDFYRL